MGRTSEPQACESSAAHSAASQEISDNNATQNATGMKRESTMLWKAECHGVLRRLMKHAKAWPFLAPVDPFEADAPDYYTVIQRPMDLGTVQKKLNDGEYADAAAVLSDIQLTFRNAIEYNPEKSTAHHFAQAMLSVLDTMCTGSMSLGAVLEEVRERAAAETCRSRQEGFAQSKTCQT